MVAIFVIFLLFSAASHAAIVRSNPYILPSSLSPSPNPPTHNSVLKEILDAIAVKERWDPNGEIRVSELDPISVRVGRSQRYEFHVRVGKTVFMLKFADGIVLWRKPERDWFGFGSGPGLEDGDGFGEEPKAEVRGLELEGPLEVRVEGGDDEIELLLPAHMKKHNIHMARHGGLKHILVGDGITIKVAGAQVVTLLHPYDIGLLSSSSVEASQFGPFGFPSCAASLLVRVLGSASVVAFQTRNTESHVKTNFHTDDSIELLPEKCYSSKSHFKHIPSWLFGSLSSKLVILQKVLRRFIGNSISQDMHARLLKAKIIPSNLVKFRLQVERDITENDRIWKRVASWRTKPVLERIWFEIEARVEKGKGWKQVLVKKLTRPIMTVESSPWSNLMSNISFTQMPSIVLPPEALTLDVNW